MYERMFNKSKEPTIEEMTAYCAENGKWQPLWMGIATEKNKNPCGDGADTVLSHLQKAFR